MRLERECDVANTPEGYLYEELEILYRAQGNETPAKYYSELKRSVACRQALDTYGYIIITTSPQERSSRMADVVGIVVFASLMALRYELSSVWARGAGAGCAAVVLGCGVFMCRRAQS